MAIAAVGAYVMHVSRDRFVTLDYRVIGQDGTVVDDGASPLRYLHGGYGDIFPKLEQALDGKAEGDSIEVRLAAADAFGAYDETLVRVETRDGFKGKPRIGATIDRDGADGGGPVAYRIVRLGDDGTVVLDANHPLAGMDIVFTATVVQVRPAGPLDIAAHQEKAGKRPRWRRWLSVDWSSLLSGRLSLRLHFHSQAHRIAWLGPTLLLPVLGGWLGMAGRENPAVGVAFGWMAWTLLGCPLIGGAISRWGEKFWIFDFSPNTSPTTLERWMAMTGSAIPVVVGLVVLGLGLYQAHSLSDVLTAVGVDLAVVVCLGIPGMIVMPFLVMVLTAFRIRPLIDDSPAKD